MVGTVLLLGPMIGVQIGFLFRAADYIFGTIRVPRFIWALVEKAGQMCGPLILFSFGLQVDFKLLCQYEGTCNLAWALLGRYIPGIIAGMVLVISVKIAAPGGSMLIPS